MTFLYALFFGAGVSAFTYTKMGKRAGYGNSQNVLIIVAVTFVLSSIVFFTILKTFIHN